MNLVAKIKRLELEAAERDKRIAALEERLAFVSDVVTLGVPHKPAPPASGPYADWLKDVAKTQAPEPKKRKPRAKTSTTE